jgi:hypothetical protein
MTAPATAPDHGAAEPSPAGALSRLIQEANDSGITYQEMADRGIAAMPGTKLPRQWYQKLVKNPPVNPPSVEQMEALQAATGQPLRRIKEAVAEQWLQYEATELQGYGNTLRIIVAHLGVMTEPERRRWLAMIEADERARRESES